MERPKSAESLGGASVAVLLGSGLGAVSDDYPLEATVPFEDIPGMSRSSVTGHPGVVQRRRVSSTPCLFVRGRKHYYEGEVSEIEALIRFLRLAGVAQLLLTSAAGSLTPGHEPGELVVVRQVLDCQLRPPFAVVAATHAPAEPARPGPVGRRLELDVGLTERIVSAAVSCGIALAPATLSSWAGPAYETRAEVCALQDAGASVASMSVAPELAVANALGIQVACVVVVTNRVAGASTRRLTHDDVLEAGGRAAPDLGRLITAFVGRERY
jgi:inosine/guanosine/xanthosine phosphorylase family protein